MAMRAHWKKSENNLKSLASASARSKPRRCARCGTPRAFGNCTASLRSKIPHPNRAGLLGFADVGLHHLKKILQRVSFTHEAVGSPEHRLFNQIFRTRHPRQHYHREFGKIRLEETQQLEPVFTLEIHVEGCQIKLLV